MGAGLPSGVYRKGNKFMVRVYIGYRQGTSLTISKTASNLNDAIKLRDELKQHAKSLSPAIHSLTSMLEAWLADIQPTIHYSTYLGYKSIIRVISLYDIGRKYFRQIKPSDLSKFYAYLQATRGLSPGRIWAIHRVIRAAFNWAVYERDLLEVSPVHPRKIRLPQLRVTKPHGVLYAEDLPRFIDACDHERPYGLIFLVLLFTGARLGEVLALRWRDILFDKGAISITRSLTKGGKKPVIEPTKTEGSTRLAAIPTLLTERLYRYRQEQQNPPGDQLVFQTRNGTPVLRWSLYHQAWRRVKDRAKVNLTIHGLRHTFMTVASELDVDAKKLQQQVGHMSATTTARYKHPSLRAQREMVERVTGRMLRMVKESQSGSKPTDNRYRGA